jgi:hypothetical protein
MAKCLQCRRYGLTAHKDRQTRFDFAWYHKPAGGEAFYEPGMGCQKTGERLAPDKWRQCEDFLPLERKATRSGQGERN